MPDDFRVEFTSPAFSKSWDFDLNRSTQLCSSWRRTDMTPKWFLPIAHCKVKLKDFLFKGAAFPRTSAWIHAFWILLTLTLLITAVSALLLFRGKKIFFFLFASMKPTLGDKGVTEQNKRAWPFIHTMLGTCRYICTETRHKMCKKSALSW